jgi:hypothetical protein
MSERVPTCEHGVYGDCSQCLRAENDQLREALREIREIASAEVSSSVYRIADAALGDDCQHGYKEAGGTATCPACSLGDTPDEPRSIIPTVPEPPAALGDDCEHGYKKAGGTATCPACLVGHPR